MVWWMRPPWRNSSHSRETNSTRWKFQIQYLFINTSPPSSIVRTSHTVSLWFSWNLNGVSRTFERWSKRSPLLPPSLVSPHYGPNKRGRNPPFFLFFPFSFFFSSFAWVDMQGRRTTTFADVIFNQRDPFSPATRLAGETLPFRCSSRGKDFPRDILRGRRYVSFRSVEGEMVSTK